MTRRDLIRLCYAAAERYVGEVDQASLAGYLLEVTMGEA